MRKQILIALLALSIGGFLWSKYQPQTKVLKTDTPVTSEKKAAAKVKISVEDEPEDDGDMIIGGYFPNWAQYRPSPYKYEPQHMAPIAKTLNHIYYGFVAFCPPDGEPKPYWVTQLGACKGKQPFELTTLEPNDLGTGKFIAKTIALKQQNPKLKVVASIGGWNFPSRFWSLATKDDATRQKFAANAIKFAKTNGFDGIDIDWEYPCSGPRTNPVKITCTKFDQVTDNGGDCASKQYEHGICSGDCADGKNLGLWLTELRKQAGSGFHISIAASASRFTVVKGYDVPTMDKALDYWNLMTYDYFVSDIESANVTAPNSLLYDSKADLGQPTGWSVDGTIKAYIAAGASRNKMVLGVAYYGHSWFVPGITDDSWKKFGSPAKKEGRCCGQFANTFGAMYGKGSGLCGSLMYSEYLANGFADNAVRDEDSGAMIAYLKKDSPDGQNKAGTWISILDETGIKQYVTYAKRMGLKGAFAFDLSEDTVDGGQFSYKLTKVMADTITNPTIKADYEKLPNEK